MTIRMMVSLTLAVAALGGCASPGRSAAGFASPQTAVDEIRLLIRAEDWTALAAKYDLSDSREPRARLESGEFFVNREAAAQPTGAAPRRVRRPFSPEFRYRATRATSDAAVVVIEMMVEIDQGDGLPVQRGYDYFKMRRNADGSWLILPHEVTAAEIGGVNRDR